MPRRIAYDSPPNRERWLVSYADFITLLFGFFVVMYAVSSVNEGKYQELTASLIEVFDTPQSSLNPIQFGEISRMAATQMIELPNSSEFAMVDRNAKPTQHSDVTPNVQAKGDTGDTVLEEISSQVKDEFKELIEQQQLKLHGDGEKISIELNSNVLFASGSSSLSRQAVELFEEIGDLLKTYANPVAVEGYTDSQKINTGEYQSNWELSAARAAAVARVLEQNGVQEPRLTATGMGAKNPIADNASEQGRKLNRRVVLVISKTVIKARPQTKTQLAAADLSAQSGSIDEQGFVSDEASSINAPQVNKTEIRQELSAWDDESGFSAGNAVAVPPRQTAAQSEPRGSNLPNDVSTPTVTDPVATPEAETAETETQNDDPFSSWLTRLQDQKRAQEEQLAALQSQKSDTQETATQPADNSSALPNAVDQTGTEIARQTPKPQDQTPAPLPKLSNGVKAKRTATGGLIFTN